MTDLDHCPKCGGPADNGYDRCIPPNVYWCTKCMPHQTNTGNPVDFPTSCSHCTHPLYAGIRCGVCGRWSDKLTPEEIAELRQSKKAIAEYVQSNFQREDKTHRIDELIQQATMVFEPDDPDYRHETFLPRKFAELIVKECAEVSVGSQYTNVKSEYYEGFNEALMYAANKIRKHFGIEP